MSKEPLDRRRYRRDAASCLLTTTAPDGVYAYVQLGQQIWVLRDRPHVHPRILGGAAAVDYAGDLAICDGRVSELTNLSGTFQFDDPEGLRTVASLLRQLGLAVESGAVRFFPPDGTRPMILE